MPKTKYTKDRLIEEFLDQSQAMTRYVERLDGTLRAINDTNKLHASAILKNTDAVQDMVSVNNRFIKLFSFIMLIIVVALVVIAGAEKALPYLFP